MTRKAVILLVVVTLLVAGFQLWKYVRSLGCRPSASLVIDDPAQLDDLHLELLDLEPESWVRRFIPEQSHAGYNLVLYRRRVPLILDMNGRVVHSWPEVRATGRVRLNRDGSLAVIGADNLIKEYTWDGQLAWHFQLSDTHHLPHHDLIRMRNGNYLVVVNDSHSHADYLLETDRDGGVVWEWRFEEHLDAFPNWDLESSDPSHANSIRELPPNTWYEDGDDRFRPGNILVSARTLNTIFIIEKTTGKVVWKHSEGLDGQHEAVMLERSLRGSGLIMVFNNGLDDLSEYRRSKVQAINPVTGESVWEYDSDFFFSSVGGTAQPLPGNTVLITSSHGGRVFEIKGKGRIVWEWAPPYLPMRVERVPLNFCPQLEDLSVPAPRAVVPKDRRPFVDIDLYSFDFRWLTDKRTFGGRVKRLISSLDGCRDLRIPVGAALKTDFGIDGERLAGESVRARFRLTIDDHERPMETLIDVTLDESSDPLFYRKNQSISRFALREVTMCIDTEVEGGAAETDGIVYWANPQIQSKAERVRRTDKAQRLTEQEKKLREQQLKALGYVD